MEFEQGYNWTYLENQLEGTLVEAPPLLLDCPPPLLEPVCYDNSFPLVANIDTNYFPFNTDMISEFGDISKELSYWETNFTSLKGNNEVDITPEVHAVTSHPFCEDTNDYAKKAQPLSSSMASLSEIPVKYELPSIFVEDGDFNACTRARTSSTNLDLDEIKKHFNLPITKAAKKMNVGLTILKKRCRELNIMRWPHRKLKSLQTLIKNVKEMGLTDEVMMLEEHKRFVERVPDLELTERTKKLRQACFKANYKKRRSLAIAYGHYQQ